MVNAMALDRYIIYIYVVLQKLQQGGLALSIIFLSLACVNGNLISHDNTQHRIFSTFSY